jgi:hypothetical protein
MAMPARSPIKVRPERLRMGENAFADSVVWNAGSGGGVESGILETKLPDKL